MTDATTKGHLVLPSHAAVHLVTPNDEPLTLSGVVISIRCCARYKNDCNLGPFFTNGQGVANITHDLLDISVGAELESGLMDYRHINECFPLVEIRLWSDAEIENAIKGRQVWGLLAREKELWQNTDELIALFRAAPNPHLDANPVHLRDEWDGRKQEYEYQWRVFDKRTQ